MRTSVPMSTASIEERVDELLARMTLEEKVGLMFHAPIFMNADGTLLDDAEERIARRHLNHFNIYFAPGRGSTRNGTTGCRISRRGRVSGSP
jgi:beta-glucosidase